MASVFLSLEAWAGGSGLNLVVVVNQNSANSVQLGNDYCQKRGVPPQNVFRMTGWKGGSVSWIRSEFEGYLRDPLLAMLAARGLTNQIDYVLLSMDIPYRVQDAGSANSTTAALFYGFKAYTEPPSGEPGGCSLPDLSSNSFAFSERPFALAHPNNADTNAFLAFMLTDTSLTRAQAILDRGIAADHSYPTQAVYLEKTSDSARNVRFFGFDNAVFDSRLSRDGAVARIASDNTAFSSIRGLLTGFAVYGLPADTFVPGALGDSLTSYGGYLFEDSGQTSLLEFLHAGAVASYGTVDEPCNYLQKFPDPLEYFYQRRGFCVAEVSYLSVLNPFQGLLVGEPLSAPYARPGQAEWSGLADGAVMSGTATLPTAMFSAGGSNLPINQIDLFIDGTYTRTLTNLPPASGNLLSVALNGSSVQYIVPDGATLFSVASGMAEALNAESNQTKVAVLAEGDRIELQSLDRSAPGTNVILNAGSSPGSAAELTTSVTAAQTGFLDTEAIGTAGLIITNATVMGDWLWLKVVKTNGVAVTVGVTNQVADLKDDGLCQLLMNAINAEPALQGSDGITAADLYPDVQQAEFFVYSRSAGWDAAQVRVTLTASPNLMVLPSGSRTLEDNLSDLRPRNHLYISSGVSSLPVDFSLDTTQFPDGFHELTLVGYEGTSVRTQTRVSRAVRFQNTSLSAVLIPQIAGTNVTLETPLSILVQANTNAISSIELFSTGGSLGAITNQASYAFAVPAGMLGLGLHSFYALVTDSLGNRFRTQTTLLRIVPAFELHITLQPPTLSWAAVPGLSYDVLSSANPDGPFQPLARVTAVGELAQWSIPAISGSQSFYRIRLSH